MRVIIALFFLQMLSGQAMAAEIFGKGDFSKPPMKLETLVKDFNKYKDQKVVVTAAGTEVCKQEGCWMKIHDGGTPVRAIMKDHGFKGPTEIKDKTVLVEGTLIQKEIPANAAKHFLRDEGKPEAEIEKVKGPQKVFQFIADGVKLG